MEMLIGNGVPGKCTKGDVGQFYKDLETGDIYKCVLSNQYSTLHHAPVGGYLWIRTLDVNPDMEQLQGMLGGGGVFTIFASLQTDETITNISHTYEDALVAYNSGKHVRLLLDTGTGGIMALPAVFLSDDGGNNKLLTFELVTHSIGQAFSVVYSGNTGAMRWVTYNID